MKKKGTYVKAIVWDRRTPGRGEARGGAWCWATGKLQEIEGGGCEGGGEQEGWVAAAVMERGGRVIRAS